MMQKHQEGKPLLQMAINIASIYFREPNNLILSLCTANKTSKPSHNEVLIQMIGTDFSEVGVLIAEA
jgi:hypothetical protein